MYFKNRSHAGWLLAKKVLPLAFDKTNTIVVSLSNGGVPVAIEIARELDVELDIALINKIRIPSNSNLVIGAVSEENEAFLNLDFMRYFDYSASDIEQFKLQALKELELENKTLKIKRLPLLLENKEVILVDDGIETGATVGVAIQLMRKMKVKKVFVAVPIASPEVVKKINNQVDKMVTVVEPQFVNSIEKWYEDFDQVENEEVLKMLGDYSISRQYPDNKNIIIEIQNSFHT
jgi:predicted phosphoribosyltransferase